VCQSLCCPFIFGMTAPALDLRPRNEFLFIFNTVNAFKLSRDILPTWIWTHHVNNSASCSTTVDSVILVFWHLTTLGVLKFSRQRRCKSHFSGLCCDRIPTFHNTTRLASQPRRPWQENSTWNCSYTTTVGVCIKNDFRTIAQSV